VWRQAAENVAESLQRGMRVIVQGRLKQRSYEDREGVKRTVFELDVEEIGPSLRNATATVVKTGGSGKGKQDAYQAARQASSQEGREDPWSSPPPAGGGSGAWSGPSGDEPPF
jgi:single-strand DNA-binding protein